jgi:DNA-binding NarL/FixJ family response regulator
MKAGELKPDIILMDISMPGGTGLEAARKILNEQPEINIVFLTVHEDDDRLFEAVKSGAKGYLLKNMRTSELVEMLRGLEQGEAAFSRGLAVRILTEFARMKNRLDASEPIDEEEVTLTSREVEILELAAAGASNREIASQLVVTQSTVKNHMRNILAKLHLKNRREAVAFARRQGLIDPPQN